MDNNNPNVHHYEISLQCASGMSVHADASCANSIEHKTDNGVTNVCISKLAPKKRGRPVKKIPDHIQKIENGFYCTICAKIFKSRSQQYYHFACGNELNKKYKCGLCEKKFSSRYHLNYHRESHSTQRYTCFQCSKTFRNQLVLKRHEKVHLNRRFECAECTKVFRNKESLKSHLDCHSNNLRFECDLCKNKYTSKSTLNQHTLTHLEKKYECTQCGKRFQRNSILKLHIKRHAKINKFTCPSCLKTFFDIDALRRHSQLHKDSKKYKCTICNVSSTRKDNMRRHLRNMHFNESFDKCVEIVEETNIKEDGNNRDKLILANKSESFKEDNEIHLPKTVANSSVIKRIGNVEPVTIPNTSKQNKSVKCHSMHSFDLSEKTDAVSSITHKKFNKKYDPIEMYRKILISGDESELDNNPYCENEKKDADEIEPELKKIIEQPRSTLNNSNFSEMHWRKNFKYTYEYQDY